MKNPFSMGILLLLSVFPNISHLYIVKWAQLHMFILELSPQNNVRENILEKNFRLFLWTREYNAGVLRAFDSLALIAFSSLQCNLLFHLQSILHTHFHSIAPGKWNGKVINNMEKYFLSVFEAINGVSVYMKVRPMTQNHTKNVL